MIATLFFFAKSKAKDVDVSAHIDPVTWAFWIGLGLVFAFFLVRPEMWRRIWFQRVDPRPAGLLRIVFGTMVLWTVIDLIALEGEFLFTDQGLWLTSMARKNYGGPLGKLWHPEHGFEHWYSIFQALWGKFSILHFRSDPAFVYSLAGCLFVSCAFMIVGYWTRTATLISWILVNSFYNYSPIYYTGGDTVLRTIFFLALLLRWGEAYSIDTWRRRRKKILNGATAVPDLRYIPVWPMRFMMIQMAIIYSATGILKSGSTWNSHGTAVYYAMNLDHFYRVPATQLVTWLQIVGILRLSTWIVHWWEILFPLSLVGAGLLGYERDKQAGLWITAALWRRILGWICIVGIFACAGYIAGLAAHYYIPKKIKFDREIARYLASAACLIIPGLLIGILWLLRHRFYPVYIFILHWIFGKRIWLMFGFLFHMGIDISMNVGTFPQLTVAPYIAWLSGAEVLAFWRIFLWNRANPGEGGRPQLPQQRWKRWLYKLITPIDAIRYRVPRKFGTVLHAHNPASIRRAALLRCWDEGQCLEFEVDESVADQELCIRLPHGPLVRGPSAGKLLVRIFPGLWWLRPFRAIPGIGSLALRIVDQRA